jgi:putative tryptophan/tyrosine transport system substrate-binding protein
MAGHPRILRRRLLIGLAAAMGVPSTFGQTARASRRVGIAFSGTPEGAKPYLDAFVRGMDEQGYVLDRSYALELRYALGRSDRYPAMLAELLAADSEVIVVTGNTIAQAARAATSSVPIVMATSTDPEVTGLVTSLSRPGGNITGLSAQSAGLTAKRVQLLREILPGASRMTLLMDPKVPAAAYALTLRETEDAAKALAFETTRADVSTLEELDQLLASLPARRPDALLIGNALLFFTYRRRIIDFCAQHRIPAIYPSSEAVIDGGLIGYAPSIRENFRKAASYVARILNGAKAADLPIEQPTRVELSVNLTTARALGITIPKALLARADEVIR